MVKISPPKLTIEEKKPFIETDERFYYLNGEFKENPAGRILLRGITFDSCLFDHIDFSLIELNNVSLIDCEFRNCDLSNLNFDFTQIRRCLFKECRLVGTSFIEANLRDVRIANSKCQLANLSQSHVNRLLFEDCDCRQIYFNNAETTALQFARCDLKRAEMCQCRLKGTDLSSCEIEGIVTDAASVRGLKVSRWQASELIRIFGIEISD